MRAIKRIIFSALLAPLLGGAVLNAAEFEVLDRFSVDGYTVLRGSADIPGGSFVVGGSTLVVKGGNVGIGTTGPAAKLEVRGADTQTYNLAVGTSAAYSMVVSTGGNVGIGTTRPVASLDVAGGIRVSSVTSCAPDTAGTLRWYDGHISVCNGTAWRQLDNQAPPTITSITPASGIVTGGTAVTIIGTGFNQGLELTIGGAPATAITVTGVLQITAVTPAGTAGEREVKITNSDGQYVTGAFTYNPLPTAGGPVSPASGTQGAVVTISGTNFVNGLSVVIGGASATVNSVSATQIIVLAPADTSPGAKDITITNPDTGAVTLTGGFTYLSPTITGVSPASGPKGTVITITGTNFVSAAGLAVTIGGAAATGFTWNSATQITATTPSSATSGAKAVTVTNRDTGSATLAGGFIYMVSATGGTVVGSYRVHTFTSGGTLQVETGGNIEALIVGGGGAGGSGAGAGGGAGGLIYTTDVQIIPGTHNVVVGAGGAGAASATWAKQENGSNSSFYGMVAYGGGRGSVTETSGTSGRAAGTGGSGGGGGAYSTCASASLTGASASQPSSTIDQGGTTHPGTGFGNRGGNSGACGGYHVSGGGAGGPGADVNSSGGSPRSAGMAVWGTMYARGGSGGGYDNASAPGSGSANTGDGGNGAWAWGGSTGGSGGSGIVIVRYPIVAGLTPPSVTSVSPSSGSGGGGTPITITGTGFAASVEVMIGNTAVASFTRVNNTTITATTPASANGGANDVLVTNNPDKSSGVKTNGFTYTAYAAGGTIVGNYYIHTFNTGGSIAFATGGNVEALVVGGGGAGGSGAGAGGGAGGLIYATDIQMIPGTYSVAVGAGGAGAASASWANQENGSNSSFYGMVANGGGRGSVTETSGTSGRAASSGGSGGGGGAHSTCASASLTGAASNQPASTTDQRGIAHPGTGFGNRGGNAGSCGAQHVSGGGAGGPGTDSSSATPRSAGMTVWGVLYARGGSGGGYDNASTPGSGSANTGDGGNGAWNWGVSTGGSGGSGIVIIRYPK